MQQVCPPFEFLSPVSSHKAHQIDDALGETWRNAQRSLVSYVILQPCSQRGSSDVLVEKPWPNAGSLVHPLLTLPISGTRRRHVFGGSLAGRHTGIPTFIFLQYKPRDVLYVLEF